MFSFAGTLTRLHHHCHDSFRCTHRVFIKTILNGNSKTVSRLCSLVVTFVVVFFFFCFQPTIFNFPYNSFGPVRGIPPRPCGTPSSSAFLEWQIGQSSDAFEYASELPRSLVWMIGSSSQEDRKKLVKTILLLPHQQWISLSLLMGPFVRWI